MPKEHRTLAANERHPLPRYEFTSLVAAEAYSYSVSDTSCIVRVGASPGPYDHYIVTHVAAGVGTLVSIGGGATDHGGLTGLTDDDHTQYLLATGARALTGNQSAGGFKITGLAAATNAGDALRFEDSISALRKTGGAVALNPAAPAVGQILVATDASNMEWQDPGAVALPLEFWEPNAPPATPHAKDDEFVAGSLDAKWGEWDVPGYVTFAPDTDRRALKINGVGNGTDRHTGIYQEVPSTTEWAIYARVSILSPSVNSMGIGLFIGQDVVTNPTTADFRTLLIFCNAGPSYGVDSGQYDAYNGSRSDGGSLVGFPASYLRFRVDGTTYWGDCSTDGIQWYTVRTGTLPSTCTHMGIMFSNANATEDIVGIADFFRVFEGAGTSDLDGTKIGRLVRGALSV